MAVTIVRTALTLAGVCIMSSGCSQGQGPFRIVQLCLADPQEVPAFVSFMDAIAQKHKMEFTDRSGATEAELRAIDNKNVPVAHPHVNIGADQSGEYNFGAGNLGLPTRQIAIGFNGRDPEAGRQFASAVVAELSTRWRIYEVPQDRGALPLPNCD